MMKRKIKIMASDKSKEKVTVTIEYSSRMNEALTTAHFNYLVNDVNEALLKNYNAMEIKIGK